MQWKIVYNLNTGLCVSVNSRDQQEDEGTIYLDPTLCGWVNTDPERYKVVDGILEEVSGYLEAKEKQAALDKKLAEILEQRKNRNNVWDFMFDGHRYVNDEQNLQGVKVQVLNKLLTDPIPTFPGLPMAGCWRTSDDQYVAFTNETFMDGLCEAYFSMRSHNFGWYGVLYSQVMALETKEEIEAFDATQGWHPATVVP